MRIAFYSPLPPERSGIADYSFELLEELRNSLDIVAVVSDQKLTKVRAPEGVELVGMSDARDIPVDCNLYQMGNNPKFHRFFFGQTFEQPGLLVMHDPSLADFTAEMCGGAESAIFRDEVAYDCPDIGPSDELPLVEVGDGRKDLDRLRVLLARRIVESNIRTLVHSSAMEHEMRRRYPGADIATIQLPAPLLVEHERSVQRRPGEIVFGVFGGINYYKRVRPLVEAFRELREAFPRARMVIAGRADEHLLERDLRRIAARPEFDGALELRTDLTLEQLEGAMLDCDVGITLRWPTAGEMSATLMRTLGAGRPAIVSDVLQFRELDERYCWRVTTDFDAEHGALVALMTRLASDPALCVTAGRAARRFVESEATYDVVAHRYVQHLEECVEKIGRSAGPLGTNTLARPPAAPHALRGEFPLGVNIIHLGGASEMADAARRTASALAGAGVDVVAMELSPHGELPEHLDPSRAPRARGATRELRGEKEEQLSGMERLTQSSLEQRPHVLAALAVADLTDADRSIFGMGPYAFDLYFVEPRVAERLGRLAVVRRSRGRRAIAVLAPSEVPISAAHVRLLEVAESVVVPSVHGAEVASMATRAPVAIIPWPVSPLRGDGPDGVRETSDCTFVCVVRARTPVAEAHPLAAIEAFRQAFPAQMRGSSVHLVMIFEGAASRPEALDLLRAELRSVHGKLVVDPSPQDRMAIIAAGDVFVTLHRATGFGLDAADAMALGMPVVATAFSGNLAYMTDRSSCLVGYDVESIVIGDRFLDPDINEVQLRGNFWTSPDVEGAARWMRRLQADPSLRRRIGDEAMRSVRQLLAPSNVASEILDHLVALDKIPLRKRHGFEPKRTILPELQRS